MLDVASGTLYVVARTKEGSAYHQYISAIDITSGQEKVTRHEITATFPIPGGRLHACAVAAPQSALANTDRAAVLARVASGFTRLLAE